MKLHLVDPKSELCAEWEKAFASLPNVTITQGKFEELKDPYECLINAGNSFGLMDGGVDLAIANYLPTVETRVQTQIIHRFAGEQPVGTSFIVRTGSSKPIYLAHTPTMRVPESIATTDNVYDGMRSALLAIHKHNADPKNKAHSGQAVPKNGSGYQIETVVSMGLGTATGKVPYDKAAYQMALAYQSILMPINLISWHEASRRHNAVRKYDKLTPPTAALW